MENKIEKHVDKVGIASSLFAALCCLGFPALLTILSAIGPQLFDQRCCQVGGVFIFIFVTFNKILVGISVAGLVIASNINVLFSHSLRNLAHG